MDWLYYLCEFISNLLVSIEYPKRVKARNMNKVIELLFSVLTMESRYSEFPPSMIISPGSRRGNCKRKTENNIGQKVHWQALLKSTPKKLNLGLPWNNNNIITCTVQGVDLGIQQNNNYYYSEYQAQHPAYLTNLYWNVQHDSWLESLLILQIQCHNHLANPPHHHFSEMRH